MHTWLMKKTVNQEFKTIYFALPKNKIKEVQMLCDKKEKKT